MNEITPEVDAALSQPQPPAPDAQAEVAQMLAQVEREKTQAKAQIDAAKLDLERQTLEAEYTRKGIEMQMKNQRDAAELRIKEAAKSPKKAARRKSFCARMSGVPGPMKDEKGRPTRKALALRKWDC